MPKSNRFEGHGRKKGSFESAVSMDRISILLPLSPHTYDNDILGAIFPRTPPLMGPEASPFDL